MIKIRKKLRKNASNDPDATPPLVERLRSIVRFLPAFEKPGFHSGEFVEPQDIGPRILSFPYATLSDSAEAFVQAAYRDNLVLTDFDWPKWARTSAAKRLRSDETALARATPEQLARLLTVCIRQDRFVEGSLLRDFESGLILQIIRRAGAILAEEEASESE